MFKSLRWSLQLWHAGLLAFVLVGFGTASYYSIRQARYQDIDAQLERSVGLLATGMRAPPRPPWLMPGEFGPNGPNGPSGPGGPNGPGGPGGGRGGRGGRPRGVWG